MGLRLTKTMFSQLSADLDLRMDSKFYVYSNKNNFKIIPKSKYKFIKLGSILLSDYEEVTYEANRKYKGIETAKSYFDDYGNIKDYLEVTEENHPTRLKFLAKKNQIVISSLKYAKAPVFLIDKENEGFILSNGFYIFVLRGGSELSRNFWYHVLNSGIIREILDEHLSRGIGISAYKERDLLLLKVPDIPEEKQKEALGKITEIKEEINGLRKKIPNTQKLIDDLFSQELDFISSKDYIKKRSTLFIVKFNEIGNRKHLRCSAKYHYFWKYYGGFIFKRKNNDNYIVLRDYIKTKKNILLKKGYLDEKRILIDKEEVEAKTGIIKEEPEVDKIESDKIEFGDCDLLISKIDPFLGHVIINQKNKRYIGTPEFIPLFVDTTKLNTQFLQYVLLSNNFLELSKKLMAGKRQPRINKYELFGLKIPEVDINIQDKLIKEINDKWGDIAENKRKVLELNKKIDKVIMKTLEGEQ